MMLVRVILLCAMMGYPIGLPGIPEKEPDEPSGSRGDLPAWRGVREWLWDLPGCCRDAWGFTAHSCIRNKPPAPGA